MSTITTSTTTTGNGSRRMRPPPSLNAEEFRRDPFRTPDGSVPPTPRSGVSNPFSPPASVVNLSSEQNLQNVHHSAGSIGSSSYYPFPDPGSPPASRPHTGTSRVSVQSSLRNLNSSSDLTPRGGARSRRNSSNGHIRSSFMSPPAMPKRATLLETDGSGTMSAPRLAKRQRSTMLTGEVSKPWVTDKDFYERLSYWVTYAVAMLGIVGAVLRVYFQWVQTPRIGNLCLVMDDNFDTFDTQYTWTQEVDMSGFG